MKNAVGLTFIFVFGILGVIGGLLAVILTGHDPYNYATLVGLLLTTIAGFVAVVRSQARQSERIEHQSGEIAKVKKQTNGTLSALLEENASLRAKVQASLVKLPAKQAQEVLDTTINHAELRKLREEVNTHD
jgi:uncharacterized membrane protein